MQCITTWTFDSLDPVFLTRLFAEQEGTSLFYSGGTFETARTSFLSLFPDQKIKLPASRESWDRLQLEMGPLSYEESSIPRWVGYLGYEMGCFSDQDVSINSRQATTPGCCFYRPTVVIQFDHHTKRATLFATSHDHVQEIQESLHKREPYSHPFPTNQQILFQSDSLSSYLAKIAQAKEWILEGEIYQVNLSHEIHIERAGNAFDYFERITQLNPAPFSVYMQCGSFAIVSSSPERFLSKRGDLLQTRPIKGTAPRGKTEEEDRSNQKRLLHSEKERAELLMITDLMRSDLGKIVLPGSVRVPSLFQCETYPNVFQLVSVIEGRAFQDVHPLVLLKKLFPGGSITGCPKLRAMQVIADLEKRARGVYTGSIGYLTGNGDFDFNIAIRTLVIHENDVQLQLGGGIVIDSDPIQEFEETLYKGASLFKIVLT